MRRILRIKSKTGIEQCLGYGLSQTASRARNRTVRNNHEVDVFRYPTDEAMRVAQGRVALKTRRNGAVLAEVIASSALTTYQILFDKRRAR
jgi:hypothetical protein